MCRRQRSAEGWWIGTYGIWLGRTEFLLWHHFDFPFAWEKRGAFGVDCRFLQTCRDFCEDTVAATTEIRYQTL